MHIRLKILIIILLVLIGGGLTTWLATVKLIQSEYITLEADNTKKDASRGVDALNNRIDQLAQKVPDWASWDDSYQFVEDHNQDYITSNLQEQSLRSLGVNFMLFYNVKQQLVHSSGVDINTGEKLAIPVELTNSLQPESELLTKKETDSHSGLIRTSAQPLIIATKPILTSSASGPVHGTLIFAKYLTEEDIKKMGELTHLNLSTETALNPDGTKTSRAKSSNTSSYVNQFSGPTRR